MTRRKNYKLVEKNPAAKFYYQGTHTHPVRRTVLVVKESSDTLVGYELREGNIVRNALKKAPIKTYYKDNIARYGDYSRLPKAKPTESTLKRTNLFNLLKEGA